MVKIVDIWGVCEGGDARSPGKPVFFFTRADVADQYAIGKGWYGGKSAVERCKCILVEEQFYLLERTEPLVVDNPKVIEYQQVLAKAKGKLTEKEMATLVEAIQNGIL